MREKILFENRCWEISGKFGNYPFVKITSKTKFYADGGARVTCGHYAKNYGETKGGWTFRQYCVPQYIIDKVVYFWKIKRLL